MDEAPLKKRDLSIYLMVKLHTTVFIWLMEFSQAEWLFFSLFYCHFITLWLLLRLLRNAEALSPRLLCLALRVKDVLLKCTHTEQNFF